MNQLGDLALDLALINKLGIINLFDIINNLPLHHTARHANVYTAGSANAHVEEACGPCALPLAPLEVVKVHRATRVRRGQEVGRERGIVALIWVVRRVLHELW